MAFQGSTWHDPGLDFYSLYYGIEFVGYVTDVRQSQRPLSLTFLNGRCTILFKEVSSNHQKKSVTKFVTDFGERFFSKKSVPKPKTNLGGPGPRGPRRPP